MSGELQTNLGINKFKKKKENRGGVHFNEGVISPATGIGTLLGKRIGKYFPPAAGNGRNLARIMTQAFCHVKEATPDSTGYKFPVVDQ